MDVREKKTGRNDIKSITGDDQGRVPLIFFPPLARPGQKPFATLKCAAESPRAVSLYRELRAVKLISPRENDFSWVHIFARLEGECRPLPL